MAAPIAFYFDFVSPYGYLGSVGIERLAFRHGRQVEWRPILLGITVLKVMGLKALADTPLKREYVRHDVERSARLMRVPFARSPALLQPLAAARAFTWLDDRDPALAKRFGQALYRAQWAEGRDMSGPEAVAEVAAELGIDRAALLAAIEDDGVKQRLRARVDEAVAAGLFGVPTFVIDGEAFWGADRIPMIEQWLASGAGRGDGGGAGRSGRP